MVRKHVLTEIYVRPDQKILGPVSIPLVGYVGRQAMNSAL